MMDVISAVLMMLGWRKRFGESCVRVTSARDARTCLHVTKLNSDLQRRELERKGFVSARILKTSSIY